MSYYGTDQLSIPDGQTLSFFLDNEEIRITDLNSDKYKVITSSRINEGVM